MKDNLAPPSKPTSTASFLQATKPGDTPGLRHEWIDLGELVSVEIKPGAAVAKPSRRPP